MRTEFGERGLVRGHICCFDVFGQPGTWQDASCLVGTQRLIMETYDDPPWVHELLEHPAGAQADLRRSLAGARYDVLELGGGDASTTVISPRLFENSWRPTTASSSPRRTRPASASPTTPAAA